MRPISVQIRDSKRCLVDLLNLLSFRIFNSGDTYIIFCTFLLVWLVWRMTQQTTFNSAGSLSLHVFQSVAPKIIQNQHLDRPNWQLHKLHVSSCFQKWPVLQPRMHNLIGSNSALLACEQGFVMLFVSFVGFFMFWLLTVRSSTGTCWNMKDRKQR